MKKELKDYLHLYLGCEVWDYYNDKKGILFGIDLNTSGMDNVKVLHSVVWDLSYDYIKPILRPIILMKNDEKKEIWKIVFKKYFPESGQILWFKEKSRISEPRWVLMSGVERLGIEISGDVWADSDLTKWKFNPNEITKYFLSKHFDIFGMIESGLAIDKTTLK